MSWKNLSKSKDNGGIGVRDLENFNTALLAKQAWRFLKQPELLAARVLKARYHQGSDISQAKVSTNSSWGWKSTLHGMEALKSGIRWIVGDGRRIKVWWDNWIPMDRPVPAVGHGLYTHPDLTVSTLIAENGHWRNNTFLAEFFPQVLIERIRELRLQRNTGSDRQIWHFTTSGNFSVKSCYDMLQQRTENNDINHGDTGTQSLFKILWKFGTPPKIRHFFWRVATRTLPVQAALRQKRAIMNATCWRCGQAEEDCLHLLLACPFSRDSWNLSGLGPWTLNHTVTGVADWIVKCINALKTCSSDNAVLKFIGICWHIWLQRNTIMFEGKKIHMMDMLREADNSVHCWMRAKSGTERTEEILRQSGEPPPKIGFSRYTRLCSVDAAWKSCHGYAGAGWAMWSNEGELTSIASKRILNCRSPSAAEAEALFHAVNFCLTQGFLDVCFFSDNRELVDLIRDTDDNVEPFSIAEDIRMLVSRFSVFNILFVPRPFNSVVDAVAKHASLATDGSLVVYCGLSVWMAQDLTLFGSYLNEIKVLRDEDDARGVPT